VRDVPRVRSLVIVATLVVAGLAAPAWGNGRRATQIELHFRPGHADDILLAATYGAVFSHDGGLTWRWLCETAVGYGGDYDPDYTYTASAATFATTYDGMTIARDDCVFATGPLGVTIPRQIALDRDGVLLVAMSDSGVDEPPRPADYRIYRSIDDGMTWNAGVTAGIGGEVWQSMEFAPSDPLRVYLTGHRLTGTTTFVMFRSDDGGASFAPLSVAAFAVDDDSRLEIAAISPVDPDRVLVRVKGWGPTVGDAFWLSIDAGVSWTEVLRVGDNARAVVFRASGEVVIGSLGAGIHRSIDHGETFTELTSDHPDVTCFREHPTTGEVWACTENLAQPPFDYSVMKTTDFATWTGVMRLQELAGPVECPGGTVQQECCACNSDACTEENPPQWPLMAAQYGIPNNHVCPGDAMPDAAPVGRPPDSCCGVTGDEPSTGLLVVLVISALRTPRRTRRARR
jgi:hypothetical protein